jgi:hypothetical protein
MKTEFSENEAVLLQSTESVIENWPQICETTR